MINSLSANNRTSAVKAKYKEFSDKYIVPVRKRHDEEGSFPHELMAAAWESGLFNGPVPTVYGGRGLTWTECAAASEELGAGCAGIGITIDTHSLACMPILLAAEEQQKKILFKRIIEKRLIGAFCLTEPDAGSDIANLKSTAVSSGSGFILNGRKRFITNGEISGFHLVFAKTEPTEGTRGISMFFVPSDAPGIKIISRMDKMGQRAAVQNEIEYHDVNIPIEYLVGKRGEGFKTAMNTFNRTRILIAALALGNARAAWDYAADWARHRIQFGKPVTANQGISFKLAEMRTEIEASRLLIQNAAFAIDHNTENQALFSSMAKYYATDKAMRITEDAIQVMGGEGYSKEHPVEKMMRDAKLCQIYEGTNEIQKVIISKNISG